MKDSERGLLTNGPGSKIMLILSGIMMWVYLLWRAIYTLPSGGYMIFGLILFIVEALQIFQNTLFYFVLFNPILHTPPKVMEDAPTVDVFITTYNEPVELLKRTIVACKNMKYLPNKVIITICDDGRRRAVRELAEQLGVNYLDRPTNEHAKAGNLNAALARTSGELVVTLDADMIPKPHFLLRTVGFFQDKNVGFVQTPQSFYNEDIFQFNTFQSHNIPNEQDLFMQIIQAGRDRYNAAIYVGSNTVFRRTALDSIGGFATGTITEDMATGMLLQAKGYRTIAHSEVLAQGLATESLDDLLKQRIRWARGTIQTMRKWNPLTFPGLSVMQRLLYLSSFLYWYFGVFKLVFIMAPLFFLLFGIPFLNATWQGILTFWLPYFLLSASTMRIYTGGRSSFFWSNLYETAMMPAIAWAVLVETITRREIPFRVTPKGVRSHRASWNRSFIIPHAMIFLLSLAAAWIGGWQLYQSTEPLMESAVLINLFWVLFNLSIITMTMLIGLERPRFRSTERFRRSYGVQISLGEQGGQQKVVGKTLDISETGCSVLLSRIERIRDRMSLTIQGKAEHQLEGRVVYYDSHPDGYLVGFSFLEMRPEMYEQWILEVYGENPLESDFRFKRKTGLLSVLYSYFKNFGKELANKVRISPRMQVNEVCTIAPFTEGMAVQNGAEAAARMLDVGLSGCRITTLPSDVYPLSTLLRISIPERQIAVVGKVVRVHVERAAMYVGIEFQDQQAGETLLTILQNQTVQDVA